MSKVDDGKIKEILALDPVEFGLYMTVYKMWSEMDWRRFTAALYQDAFKEHDMGMPAPEPHENLDRALMWLRLDKESSLYKQIIEDVRDKVSKVLLTKIGDFQNYVLKNSNIDVHQANAYVEQYFDTMYYGTSYRFKDYLSTLKSASSNPVIGELALSYDAQGNPVAEFIKPTDLIVDLRLPKRNPIKREQCVPNFATAESQFDFMDYYVQNLQGDRTGYKLSDIKIGIPAISKLLTEVEPSKVITEGGKVYLEVGNVEKPSDITVEFTPVDVTDNKAARDLAEKILKRRNEPNTD